MDEMSWTAMSLLRDYRTRRLSPVEVIRSTFDRVRRLNPLLNAYVALDEEAAVKAAVASEKRWFSADPCGPLDGVPTSIKDCFDVRGLPTRSGSLATSPEAADSDALVTAFLRRAGAIILGKTALPEFGFKSTTDSALSGTTRNPWDVAMTPGGSSGGAAAAAAAGMGVLHIGTDGGGSIRQPASFCGVSGFKPSSGRVPNVPVGLYRSILCTGPIARSAYDCGLMLRAIALEDKRDPFCLPTLTGDVEEAMTSASLHGLKVAYFPRLDVQADPEITTAIDNAMNIWTEMGAHIDTCERFWPSLRDAISIIVECHKDYNVANFPESRRHLINADYVAMANRGGRHSARQYIDALAQMDRFSSQMASFTQQYDAIVTPTMPILPFETENRTPAGFDTIEWYDLESFLYPFSLSGQPAISVPCAISRSGLPIGMQIIGSRMNDVHLLGIANAYQRINPPPIPAIASNG